MVADQLRYGVPGCRVSENTRGPSPARRVRTRAWSPARSITCRSSWRLVRSDEESLISISPSPSPLARTSVRSAPPPWRSRRLGAVVEHRTNFRLGCAPNRCRSPRSPSLVRLAPRVRLGSPLIGSHQGLSHAKQLSFGWYLGTNALPKGPAPAGDLGQRARSRTHTRGIAQARTRGPSSFIFEVRAVPCRCSRHRPLGSRSGPADRRLRPREPRLRLRVQRDTTAARNERYGYHQHQCQRRTAGSHRSQLEQETDQGRRRLGLLASLYRSHWHSGTPRWHN